MKAIKILPIENKVIVEELDIDGLDIDGLEDMQSAVKGRIEKLYDFEYEGKNHTIYVNEEYHCIGSEDWAVFAGCKTPWKGNALIVGFNPETGESEDVTITKETVENAVAHLHANIVGMFASMVS